MALTGIHVLCANVVSKSNSVTDLPGNLVWSETFTSAGTTSNASTGDRNVFIVSAAVDAYVAIGSAPNAAQSPRAFIRAGTDRELFPNAGDKLAWIAA